MNAATPPPQLAAPPKAAKKPSPAQAAMRKLGLVRDMDLALHLPLRYEDETHITPLKNARDGEVVQIEATVLSAEVALAPRRLLRVVVDDGTGRCTLTFFSFFANWPKTFAAGARLRLRGEIKGGFWGRQMLHPAHRAASAPLPAALTPVYPTTAALPQAYLRRAIVTALARLRLPETLPEALLAALPIPKPLNTNNFSDEPLPTLARALHTLHHPAANASIATLEDRSHPAWRRLKAEELLAQQLSQTLAREQRQRQRAPILQLLSPNAPNFAQPSQKSANGALGGKAHREGTNERASERASNAACNQVAAAEEQPRPKTAFQALGHGGEGGNGDAAATDENSPTNTPNFAQPSQKSANGALGGKAHREGENERANERASNTACNQVAAVAAAEAQPRPKTAFQALGHGGEDNEGGKSCNEGNRENSGASEILEMPAISPNSSSMHGNGGDPAQNLLADFLAALPFALTAAQQRVCAEIAGDLARAVPMHRLLQGDVGSGKTVVAAVAAVICIASGWQCALMAPTEILAEQHFMKLVGWLENLLAPLGKRVAWLAGAQKKREREQMLALVASGQAALVVGTHAVIEQQVQFARLGLAIIDEQHRFGVAQRLALRSKNANTLNARATQNLEPHMLMMSATPIPRTLAMSYYADLDVSIIDALPPGRTPIVTKVISDSRRDEVIERVAAQIALGRQAYWVCPLIEESEALDLTNATATYEQLSEALPGVLVGLLHSRMASAEKKAVMQMFSAGHMGLLVSTTVIEVGVDVPNASLMVIEHAERFGLSQLHQLRGRVGRGAAASACVLLYSVGEGGSVSENGKQRLRAMAETADGFEIARRDLEIRGPGEFLGARQSGAAMLRFADLAEDEDLLEWARAFAPAMLARHRHLALEHMQRWLGDKAEFLKA